MYHRKVTRGCVRDPVRSVCSLGARNSGTWFVCNVRSIHSTKKTPQTAKAARRGDEGYGRLRHASGTSHSSLSFQWIAALQDLNAKGMKGKNIAALVGISTGSVRFITTGQLFAEGDEADAVL